MTSKIWTADLTPRGGLFALGCWASLAAYGAAAALWWPRPWADWAERMLFLLLVPATAVLALSHMTLRRGGILAAISTAILALLLAAEPTSRPLEDARQTAAMMWVFTTALAVHHDSRWRAGRMAWWCWGTLAVLHLGARYWERLPWEAWSRNMLLLSLLPSLAIVASAGFHRDFRRTLAVVGMGGFYWQLLTAGDVQDADHLRKTTVVLWLLTVALAVAHDAAKVSGPPSAGHSEKRFAG